MTPSQQAALEQAAREWLMNNEIAYWGGRTSALVKLLAAERAKALEEAVGKFAYAATTYRSREEALNEFGEWLCQQAQEQRP